MLQTTATWQSLSPQYTLLPSIRLFVTPQLASQFWVLSPIWRRTSTLSSVLGRLLFLPLLHKNVMETIVKPIQGASQPQYILVTLDSYHACSFIIISSQKRAQVTKWSVRMEGAFRVVVVTWYSTVWMDQTSAIADPAHLISSGAIAVNALLKERGAMVKMIVPMGLTSEIVVCLRMLFLLAFLSFKCGWC